MRHTVPFSGHGHAVRAQVQWELMLTKFLPSGTAENGRKTGQIGGIALPARCFTTALIKPSRASEWRCPLGSST
jgi:hypothetical protein